MSEIKNWIENKSSNLSFNSKKYYNLLQINKNITSAAELSTHFLFENRILPRKILLPTKCLYSCYMCKKKRRKVHGIYVFCCVDCGNKNIKILHEQHSDYSRSILKNTNSVVIGGRTKLGYQVALRLLRNGSNVIITTRSPKRALVNYKEEEDYYKWKNNLYIYPNSLDLNDSAINIQTKVNKFYKYLKRFDDKLDFLFNIAAQTIRNIGKYTSPSDKLNRYKDPSHLSPIASNSWNLQIGEVSPTELEEVFRVNAIAPFILIQTLIPLLKRSTHIKSCIINTHAKEGNFDVSKSGNHPHTNMAKSALHQLTLMINKTNFNNVKISCYGVDPGWISVDEYYKESAPFIAPPLTELDGASRMLYPILSKKNYSSKRKTNKHYTYFTY